MPQEHICVICEEAITNPICLDCMEKEVKSWLMDKQPSLVNHVEALTSVFRCYNHTGEKCVICGNEMNICSHCYIKELRDMIKQYYPEIAKEEFWPLEAG